MPSPAVDTPPRLVLAIPEAASLIGRTSVATRQAIQRGQIPARKFGGKVVILRSELERFLDQLPAYRPGAGR